jgi:hypothetical protein
MIFDKVPGHFGPTTSSSGSCKKFPDLCGSGSTTLIVCKMVLSRDAPDIRPDNPAFSDIRYPAGYQIALPDIR